ncbi:MAG: anhydro-N-acetylmuramic acid kinase [Chloroflexi bacterium]|nr:anhydro-N-acetylmuramic acid kinase [Chloroflexota bacterium]
MLRVIGMISGTSADGIDAALCEIDGTPPRLTARILRAKTYPYPPALRDRVLIAMQPGRAGADELCKLNFAVGAAFAEAARTIAAGEPFDLVSSHGQTVWHQVEPDGQVSATLQIGEGSVIAEQLGVTTISNLRARDVAAGGQGAPLVSYLDWLLLRHDSHWRAVQNIGGIGNVTFLPPLSDESSRLVAFDNGPGNALIDSAISILTNGAAQFDRDGALGAQGTPDDGWLAELLAHPYYAMRPPKTTGRELFGTEYAAGLVETGRARDLNDADLISTITALTARSIAASYRAFAPAPIGEIIIGGGGRHNPTLIGMIRALVDAPVSFSDDHGIDADSKEALLFALLGHEAWHNRIGTLPEQTGARHGSVLGQITPGANYVDPLRRTFCE